MYSNDLVYELFFKDFGKKVPSFWRNDFKVFNANNLSKELLFKLFTNLFKNTADQVPYNIAEGCIL